MQHSLSLRHRCTFDLRTVGTARVQRCTNPPYWAVSCVCSAQPLTELWLQKLQLFLLFPSSLSSFLPETHEASGGALIPFLTLGICIYFCLLVPFDKLQMHFVVAALIHLYIIFRLSLVYGIFCRFILYWTCVSLLHCGTTWLKSCRLSCRALDATQIRHPRTKCHAMSLSFSSHRALLYFLLCFFPADRLHPSLVSLLSHVFSRCVWSLVLHWFPACLLVVWEFSCSCSFLFFSAFIFGLLQPASLTVLDSGVSELPKPNTKSFFSDRQAA